LKRGKLKLKESIRLHQMPLGQPHPCAIGPMGQTAANETAKGNNIKIKIKIKYQITYLKTKRIEGNYIIQNSKLN
jgi:hypothetical protein